MRLFAAVILSMGFVDSLESFPKRKQGNLFAYFVRNKENVYGVIK